MKKKIILALSLALCLTVGISLVACGKKKHEADSAWSNEETKHWHNCVKEGHDDKLDEAEHTFGNWTVITPADYGVAGVEKGVCSVCEYEKTRPIEALSAKDNEIKVDEIKLTYNGKSQPIDSLIKATNKEGMTIKYVGTGETTYAESATAPTDAGTYRYTISIPATAEWKPAEKTGDYTIAKYELKILYKEYLVEYNGDNRVWLRFNTLADNTGVNIAIIMDSANVGAIVSDVWLPGLLDGNYTFDIGQINTRIVPMVIGGKKEGRLFLEIADANVQREETTQTIEREIAGAKDEKITVVIEFRPGELINERYLNFSTDGSATGDCKISFKNPNPNYVFADDIGELQLV